MAGEHLGKQIPKVSGNRKIPPLVEPVAAKARPVSVHAPAPNATPQNESHATVPMVGAAIPVLARGAPELGKGDEHHVGEVFVMASSIL